MSILQKKNMIKVIHNKQIRKVVYVRRGMAAGHRDKGNE